MQPRITTGQQAGEWLDQWAAQPRIHRENDTETGDHRQ